MVAHRGASDEAPENTLPAFDRALAAGAPVVECDVHLSADGVVVVVHDPDLRRTGGRRGRVARMDWETLAAADVGYPRRWGERFAGTPPPRLEQLLERVAGRAQPMVEVKREAVDRSGGVERAVIAAARECGALPDLCVISMSWRALRRIRAQAPEVSTGFVLRRTGGRAAVERCIEAGVPFLIGPSGRWLRAPRLAEQARAAGLRLGAYVVNDRETLAGLLELGVESLATDRPADLAEWLRAGSTAS